MAIHWQYAHACSMILDGVVWAERQAQIRQAPIRPRATRHTAVILNKTLSVYTVRFRTAYHPITVLIRQWYRAPIPTDGTCWPCRSVLVFLWLSLKHI